MNKRFAIRFSLFVIPILLAGCNQSTQNVQVQDIVELKWQSDASALFGFIQSYTSTGTSVIPSTGYSLARFNSDGSLAQIYKTDPLSRPSDPGTALIESYSPSIYVSSDGSTIVTQLENDLYRYNTKSNALEKLQAFFHLIVVSPDLHYAVGTNSPGNQPIKTIAIYDLTGSPIRQVTTFEVDSLVLIPGVWLSNGTFGLTIRDTAGRHISIFDMTGALRQRIAGAETAFHNTVFFPQTNHLFIRKSSGSSTPVNQSVNMVDLNSMIISNVLNLAVENFDVSNDEQVIAYSAFDATSTIHMRSRNLLTSNELPISDDIQLVISLSPSNDKLGYIRHHDQHFNDIHVIPFIKP